LFVVVVVVVCFNRILNIVKLSACVCVAPSAIKIEMQRRIQISMYLFLILTIICKELKKIKRSLKSLSRFCCVSRITASSNAALVLRLNVLLDVSIFVFFYVDYKMIFIQP
jgi:hypothetical protein